MDWNLYAQQVSYVRDQTGCEIRQVENLTKLVVRARVWSDFDEYSDFGPAEGFCFIAYNNDSDFNTASITV